MVKFGTAKGNNSSTTLGMLPADAFLPSAPPSGGGGAQAPRGDRPFEDLGKTKVNLFGYGPNKPQLDPSMLPAPKDPAFKGVPVLQQVVGEFLGGIAENETIQDVLFPTRSIPGKMIWDAHPNDPDRMAWEEAVRNNSITLREAQARFLRQLAERENMGPALFRDLLYPGTSNLGGAAGQLAGTLSIPQRLAQKHIIQPLNNRYESFVGASDEELQKRPDLIALRDAATRGTKSREEVLDELILMGYGNANPYTGPLGGVQSIVSEIFTDPVNMLSLGLAGTARAAVRATATAAKVAKVAIPENLAAELGAKIAAKGLPATDDVWLREALKDDKLGDIVEAALKGESPMTEFLVLRAPAIRRVGMKIEQILDPFTLFGRDEIGKWTERSFSWAAGSGAINAFGAGIYRMLHRVIATDMGDEAAEELLDGFDRAAAQNAVQVGNAQNIDRIKHTQRLDGMDSPTPVASGAARALGSDIAERVQDHVDRTRLLFVPLRKGAEGVAEMMSRARTRAVNQLVNLGNGKIDRAAAEATVDRIIGKGQAKAEKALSMLDFAHYGRVVKDFLAARSNDAAALVGETLDRVTFIGPRQLTRPDVDKLRKALKRAGGMVEVRQMIHRFDDLYRTYDVSLGDDELRSLMRGTIDQLEEHTPTVISDLTKLSPALREFHEKYSPLGYHLGLRPADEVINRPIYDEMGRLAGANPWIDYVDEKTARHTIGRMQVAQRQLFSNISSAAVYREAQQRFVRIGAERFGLPQAALETIFAKLLREAGNMHTGPRGLQQDEMWRIANDVKLPQDLRRRMTERQFTELVLESYEGTLGRVGLSQKFTGVMKTRWHRAFGENWVGVIAERLYPMLRFTKNPFFWLQEIHETPFFMLLRGRIPMKDFKRAFTPSGRDEMSAEVERTLWVMSTVERKGSFYSQDQIEQSILVTRGNAAINQEIAKRGFLQNLGRLRPSMRGLKEWGVARSFQYEQARNLSKAVRSASPESWRNYLTWLSARAGARSDQEAVTNFLYDAVARSDPESAYSQFGPAAFKPQHLGAESRMSTRLIRALVMGDGEEISWSAFQKRIRDPKDVLTTTDVESALSRLGADPVYIERAISLTVFPSPAEFYKAFKTLGRTPTEIAAMRATALREANARGLSEHEYLSRIYADSPMAISHLGEAKGRKLFQAVSDAFEARGVRVVDPDGPEIAALQEAGRPYLPDFTEKARDFHIAREKREADPALGLPPSLEPAAFRAATGLWTPAEVRAADKLSDVDVGAVTALRDDPADVIAGIEHAEMVPLSFIRPYVEIDRAVVPLSAASDGYLDTLAKDMQENGLHSPITIMYDPDSGMASLVDGNHRFAAAAQLGWDEVPVSVEVQRGWADTGGLAVPVAGRPVLPVGWAKPSALFKTENLPSSTVSRNGQVVHRFGEVKGDDWWEMLHANMDEATLREKADWYIDMRRGFLALAKNDPNEAARLCVLFAATQLNTSPMEGMKFVQRVLAAYKRGDDLPIDPKFSGLNSAALKNAIETGELSTAGLGQKLMDFVDSMVGMPTRTVGVHGPDAFRAWQPAAIDIWAKRDLGFLDRQMSGYLGRLYNGKAVWSDEVGFTITNAEGTFVIPKEKVTGNAPSNTEYDYGVQFYNERAAEANARGFLDKRHWTAAEMQAMGWFRTKFAMGDMTGSPLDAFFRNRHSVHWEAVPGPNSPFSEVFPDTLPEGVVAAVTHDIAPYVQMEAERLIGVNVIARYDGVGTWNGGINPNAAFEIAGDMRDASAFARTVAYLSQQEGVPVARLSANKVADPSAGRLHAVDWSPAEGIATHADAERVLRKLAENNPLAREGASIVRYDDGSYGVRSVWASFDEKFWGGGTLPVSEFKKAHPDLGGTVEGFEPERVVVESTYHENKFAAARGGEDHLTWLRENGYAKVADELAGPTRSRASLFYERTYRKHDARGLADWRAERAASDPDWERRAGPLTDDLDAAYGTSVALDAERGPDLLARATRAADAGDALFQRAPRGTLGAIAFDASDNRARVYLNKNGQRPNTWLHEESHRFAEQKLDASGRKLVLDLYNDLVKDKKVPPAKRGGALPTPQTTWTEEVHEWFANEYINWVRTGDAPTRTLEPLFGYYSTHLKGIRGSTKVTPEIKSMLDEIAKRPVRAAHGFNVDEQALFSLMQAEGERSARNARDLIHFRTNRSWLERSLNHPYFGMYPLSYMWGKVLPELVEFLAFRPFGLKAPLVALNTVNDIYASVMLQEEHDPELREFMKNNEPALRALAMLVPGVPWDLPVNSPLWLRRVAEAVATQNQRMLEGKRNPDGTPANIDLTKIDLFRIATDVAGYALNPVRGFENIAETVEGFGALGGLVGNVLSGGQPPESAPLPIETPALTTDAQNLPPPAPQPIRMPIEVTLEESAVDLAQEIEPGPSATPEEGMDEAEFFAGTQ